jgi:hypothetical protein
MEKDGDHPIARPGNLERCCETVTKGSAQCGAKRQESERQKQEEWSGDEAQERKGDKQEQNACPLRHASIEQQGALFP